MDDDLRRQIESRDGPGCFLCRSLPVRRFHINPAKGDDVGNLVAMCEPCRNNFQEGVTHRESYMDQHRWVVLLQRMSASCFKRFRKPSTFNRWTAPWNKARVA